MASVINNAQLPRQSSPPRSSSGRYESLAGIPIYVSGSRYASKAIIDLSSSSSLVADEDTLVIVPDGPIGESRSSKITESFATMHGASAEAQNKWPAVEAWGVYGLGKTQDEVQLFYNPLAALLYIQLTTASEEEH